MTEENNHDTSKKIGTSVRAKCLPAAPLCQTRKNARTNTAGQRFVAMRAPTDTHQFDAPLSLQALRLQRHKKRRQRFHRSRLTQWRAEIVELRQAGASYREIKMWLAMQKRITVSHTDVLRFVKKLPEMQSSSAEELIRSELDLEENNTHA